MKKKFKCKFCPARFSQEGRCSRHETQCDLNESASIEFKCPNDCGFQVSSLVRLKKHLPKCSHSRVNQQDVTPKTVIGCTDITSICDDCGQTFSRRENLDVHLQNCNASSQEHPSLTSNQKDIGELDDLIKLFKCKNCPATFTDKLKCYRHEKRYCNNIYLAVCHICGAVIRGKDGLDYHLLKCHPSSKQNLPLSPNTSKEKELRIKEVLDSMEKPFNCNVCKATFAFESNYTTHKNYCKRATKTKSGKSFLCHICGGAFKSSEKLEVHLESCNSSLNKILSSSLKASITGVDDGEYKLENTKPFKCKSCPATFTKSSNCTRHENCCRFNKSAVKSYICHICGAAFGRKDGLGNHLLRCNVLSQQQLSSNVENEEGSAVKRKMVKPFKCKYCPSTFTIKTNCNRHETYCKFNKARQSSVKHYVCEICGAVFSRKYSLKQHSKCCRPSSQQEESSLSDTFPVHEQLDEKDNPLKCNTSTFQCEFCRFLCRRKLSLLHHEKHCPSKPDSSKSIINTSKSIINRTRCLVTGCHLNFYHGSSLLHHLKMAHKDEIEFKDTVIKVFSSFDKFNSWKEAEEESSFSYFIRKSGVKSNTTYYYCQHGGRKDKTKTKTRRVRSKGSIKYKDRCIARMKVRSSNEKIYVEYFPTHSHPCSPQDLVYHPIPKEITKYINDQLAKEISPAVIYSQIKETFRKDNPDNARNIKINNLTRKTIVERARKLRFNKRLDPNDAKSVTLLVEQKKEEDSVLLYKPLSESIIVGPVEINQLPNADNLFLLGMQTLSQLELMKEHCTKILVVDETNGTNQFEYKLLTCLVVDDNRRGWPVAHLITSRSDSETLKYFFAALEIRLGDAKISCVITDDDSAIIDGMKQGLRTDIRHLLCQWHVINDIKDNLTLTVDKKHHVKIFDELRVMVNEENEIKFYTLFGDFTKKYEHYEKAYKFIDYFNRYYQNKPEKWATCHRNFAHREVNTTGQVKSFHNRLKETYLKSKVKRLDDLVNVLYKIEREDHSARVREQNIRFLTLPQPISDRHERGLLISDKAIKNVLDRMYEIIPKTSTSRTKVVIKHDSVCDSDRCHWKCSNERCENLCSHMYSCDCSDRHPLCEHIHKLHSYLRSRRNYLLLEEPGEITQTCDTLSDQCQIDNEYTLSTSNLSQMVIEEYQVQNCLPESINYQKEIESQTVTEEFQYHTSLPDLLNEQVEVNSDAASSVIYIPQIVLEESQVQICLSEPINDQVQIESDALINQPSQPVSEKPQVHISTKDQTQINMNATPIGVRKRQLKATNQKRMDPNSTLMSVSKKRCPPQEMKMLQNEIVTVATSPTKQLLENMDTHLKFLNSFISSPSLHNVSEQQIAKIDSILSQAVSTIKDNDKL